MNDQINNTSNNEENEAPQPDHRLFFAIFGGHEDEEPMSEEENKALWAELRAERIARGDQPAETDPPVEMEEVEEVVTLHDWETGEDYTETRWVRRPVAVEPTPEPTDDPEVDDDPSEEEIAEWLSRDDSAEIAVYEAEEAEYRARMVAGVEANTDWSYDAGYAHRDLTCKEVSDKYGVKPATVRQACNRGAVKATKVGRDWHVDPADARRMWGKAPSPQAPDMVTVEGLLHSWTGYDGVDIATADGVALRYVKDALNAERAIARIVGGNVMLYYGNDFHGWRMTWVMIPATPDLYNIVRDEDDNSGYATFFNVTGPKDDIEAFQQFIAETKTNWIDDMENVIVLKPEGEYPVSNQVQKSFEAFEAYLNKNGISFSADKGEPSMMMGSKEIGMNPLEGAPVLIRTNQAGFFVSAGGVDAKFIALNANREQGQPNWVIEAKDITSEAFMTSLHAVVAAMNVIERQLRD